MGVIVDEIRRLLERQLEENQIVLWFDPDRNYEDVISELGLSSATILRYRDGFYRLRYEAEPLLRQPEKPRLLVYLPVEYENASLPLAELIAFGETLRPGEKGLANTRLSVIARRALKPFVPESKLDGLDREIEENHLSLVELENLAIGSASVVPTVLEAIYETPYLEDVALSFLANSGRDADLVEKNAVGELTEMLKSNYAAPVNDVMPLAEIRGTTARHILTTELVSCLGSEAPDALSAVATAEEPAVAARCLELARAWRNRLDLGNSYANAATLVEQSLHLAAMDIPFAALQRAETFPEIDRQLLRETARRLAAGAAATAVMEAAEIARKRRNGFWAMREPELQPRWDLVLQAAELQQLCRQLDGVLKTTMPASALARAYVSGDQPWSRLDTLHRHFEKKASSLEFLLSEQPAEIEQMVTATRHRYAETAGRMAEAFVRALVVSNFEVPGIYRQVQNFERAVAPEVVVKRVAYLMVDALRYELARELVDLLSNDFEAELEAVTGTMPGVTDVGMAALLPHAANAFTVRPGKKETVEVLVGDDVLRNREDRISYLEKHAGVSVVSLRLEDPKQFKTRLKKLGGGAGLVVVTSREIDRVGEEDLTEARRYMDDVLRHVRLAVHILAKAGVEYFVVAADHGYLFGEDLSESEKIDPPGGHTALLHRRVWVGEGGASSDSYLRSTLKKFGVRGDLELAVPWNLAGFRAGGSEAYFHGGLSPQEFLLPLIRLRPKAAMHGAGAKKVAWNLKLGSGKITTVHLTVTISGDAGFFETEWPRVRVEVRAGDEPCAMAVSASYSFTDATGEVALRGLRDKPGEAEPNAITLMLTPKAPRSGTVSIHLLDAISGVELKKLDSVEVSRVF
jgi:PglZ domain